MANVELFADRPEGPRHIRAAVGAEHPADADTARAEPGHGARQTRRAGWPELVAEDFDVGDAAVIVDCDVDVLPADATVLPKKPVP
jgi:hypothetical protein